MDFYPSLKITKSYICKGWLSSLDDDSLRTRKREIESETDWDSGSILDGDFD